MNRFPRICLLAIIVTGCGGAAPRDSANEFKGEDRKVAAAVEALETAGREADADAVCTKLLADELLATLKQQGVTCRTAIKQQFRLANSFDVTVDDVTITGDKAVAKVTSGTGSDEKPETLELVRSGAAWKISLLRQ